MIESCSYIRGVEIKGDLREEIEVRNPFNNELIGIVSCATTSDVELAVEVAHEIYQQKMKSMPAYERSTILRRAADLLEIQAPDFANTLAQEAGKPIVEARGEVARAIQVLRFASEGAKNLNGEQIVLDNALGGEGQIGIAKRVPIGVVAAITPFNFPLNMSLHKVAPAIAAGNTIVLKPAEKTPLSAIKLYKLFEQAGLPKGAFNLLNGPGEQLVETLVTHPLVKKVTFTGSSTVGWKIQEMAKGKKITLELGSNAPNIVFEDADIDHAVNAITMGGFTFAGQACVSAQRIFVHQTVYKEFIKKIVEKVSQLRMGDPLDESTELGPMITEEAAKRAEEWVDEAVAQGAVVLTGGKRHGTMMQATILDHVRFDMKVVCAEVFAPIISIMPFTREEDVIKWANDTEFGLQAGIFTNNINRALRVAEQLETGGVWINEVSVKRYDHIPYGGVKKSGVGKEGIQYSIEGMTELKFIGINILP